MTALAQTSRVSYAAKRQRRKRLDLAKQSDEPCCRCGKPIDYDMPPSQWRHPMYATLDHLDGIADGYPVITTADRLGPAHKVCNERAGAAVGNRGRAKRSGKKRRRNRRPRYLSGLHSPAHAY